MLFFALAGWSLFFLLLIWGVYRWKYHDLPMSKPARGKAFERVIIEREGHLYTYMLSGGIGKVTATCPCGAIVDIDFQASNSYIFQAANNRAGVECQLPMAEKRLLIKQLSLTEE